MAGPVTLRGCSDGTVEMCAWKEEKDKDTGEMVSRLVPFKWFANISQAFDRVARMRVASANAATLKELVAEIKKIREDIKHELSV